MDQAPLKNNPTETKSGEIRTITKTFENNYQQYRELGGIINENDYTSTLERANNPKVLDKKNQYKERQVVNAILQGVNMARFSKIELGGSKDTLDLRILLYVILRLDKKPENVEHHHSQMSDQQILAEALRMLGDADSLTKLVKAYPNISFKYSR